MSQFKSDDEIERGLRALGRMKALHLSPDDLDSAAIAWDALDPDERLRFTMHTDACEGCRKELEQRIDAFRRATREFLGETGAWLQEVVVGGKSYRATPDKVPGRYLIEGLSPFVLRRAVKENQKIHLVLGGHREERVLLKLGEPRDALDGGGLSLAACTQSGPKPTETKPAPVRKFEGQGGPFRIAVLQLRDVFFELNEGNGPK